jgi:hypothetical protein
MASVLSCNMRVACIGAIQHDDWFSPCGGSSDGKAVNNHYIKANSNLTLTLNTNLHARMKAMITTDDLEC